MFRNHISYKGRGNLGFKPYIFKNRTFTIYFSSVSLNGLINNNYTLFITSNIKAAENTNIYLSYNTLYGNYSPSTFSATIPANQRLTSIPIYSEELLAIDITIDSADLAVIRQNRDTASITISSITDQGLFNINSSALINLSYLTKLATYNVDTILQLIPFNTQVDPVASIRNDLVIDNELQSIIQIQPYILSKSISLYESLYMSAIINIDYIISTLDLTYSLYTLGLNSLCISSIITETKNITTYNINQAVKETDEDLGYIDFIIIREGELAAESISLIYNDVNSVRDIDYTPIETVSFSENESFKLIVIPIIDNLEVQQDRTFTVSLNTNEVYLGSNSQIECIIRDVVRDNQYIPSSNLGLQYWWDFSNSSTRTTNGYNLVSVIDKLNNISLLNSDVSTQPIYSPNGWRNSLPCADISGLSTIECTDNLININRSFTLILVIQPISFNKNTLLLDNNVSVQSTGWLQLRPNKFKNITYRLKDPNASSITIIEDNLGELTNIPTIIFADYNEIESKISITTYQESYSSYQESLVSLSINMWATGMHLNVNDAGNYLFGEILLYNKSLNTTEKQEITTYLSSKWDVRI